jgi:hypothetical protein
MTCTKNNFCKSTTLPHHIVLPKKQAATWYSAKCTKMACAFLKGMAAGRNGLSAHVQTV